MATNEKLLARPGKMKLQLGQNQRTPKKLNQKFEIFFCDCLGSALSGGFFGGFFRGLFGGLFEGFFRRGKMLRGMVFWVRLDADLFFARLFGIFCDVIPCCVAWVGSWSSMDGIIVHDGKPYI